MKTLLIKDLSVTTELDRKAMAAVHGGYLRGFAPYWYSPTSIDMSSRTKVDAQQFIGQTQTVETLVGNGSAFLDHIHSNVTTSQNANNNVNVF